MIEVPHLQTAASRYKSLCLQMWQNTHLDMHGLKIFPGPELIKKKRRCSYFVLKNKLGC